MIFVPTSGNACETLVSSSVDDNTYTLLDIEKITNGFLLSPKDKTDPFQISVNCDKDQKEPEYAMTSNGLNVNTKDGCGMVNEAARVFFNNKIVFSLVFMAIGIVFMVFGGWKWDKLLMFFGFFAGFSAVFFLFWAFVDYEQSTKSYIIISVVAIIIGAILGYVCKIFDFVSYFTLGFFGGFFLTKFLVATFPNKAMEDWVVSLITYATAVIAGVICIFTGKYFMVIITAVIGSFVFWYNFGFLINVLPNMFDFIEKFKTYGKLNALNITFLAIAGVCAFGFTVFQYKMIHRDNLKKKEFVKDKKFEALI